MAKARGFRTEISMKTSVNICNNGAYVFGGGSVVTGGGSVVTGGGSVVTGGSGFVIGSSSIVGNVIAGDGVVINGGSGFVIGSGSIVGNVIGGDKGVEVVSCAKKPAESSSFSDTVVVIAPILDDILDLRRKTARNYQIGPAVAELAEAAKSQDEAKIEGVIAKYEKCFTSKAFSQMASVSLKVFIDSFRTLDIVAKPILDELSELREKTAKHPLLSRAVAELDEAAKSQNETRIKNAIVKNEMCFMSRAFTKLASVGLRTFIEAFLW